MSSVTAFRSISFSGAGFLGCYHVGVAACLLHQGHVLPRGHVLSEKDPALLLTGVSAGSLASAGVSVGVHPEDGMNVVLEVSRRTREAGGILDCLRPGFSLIDQVHDLITRALKEALGGTAGSNYNDYDKELLSRRIRGGKLLHIGLTNRNVFPPFRNQEAYVYVDHYRDVEDIVAACILSSYLPGLTGPVQGLHSKGNPSVKLAMTRIKEMETLGFVKSGTTGEPVYNQDDNDSSSREVYWDGGLVTVWPTIDENTVVVTPISGNFEPNPYICPEATTETTERESESESEHSPGKLLPDTLVVKDGVRINLCLENLDTMWRMAHSSEEAVLQDKFVQGYDDAKRFLDRHNLLNVYSG